MARFGIIKGHLLVQVSTNILRVTAVIVLFIITRSLPDTVFAISYFSLLPFLLLIAISAVISYILIPTEGIKIISEIRFYNQKTGTYWPLFIFNRYLLHICQIVTISFMLMLLGRSFNPAISGIIVGGLWASIDLLLRNYRFGIYNFLSGLILSFAFNQFDSFTINIIIGLIPQII